MRIERIDDKTVKCYLSVQDLEEYNIDYKDFILRSDKAREVVHDIFVQAAKEVNYQPPQTAFDLQIMLMPDKGLILTFSEREPGSDEERQFMECLQEMKKMFQSAKDSIAESKNPKETTRREPPKPEFAVFVFSGLPKLMNFAQVLPANLRVESSLYLLDGYYYLYFCKGHASYERYSRACIQAMEFAGLYAAEETHASHIKEHGECLIAEKAIRKLRG